MNHDVVIVGAGPAGLTFARSIAHLGLRIAVIEKQGEEALAAPEFDGRDIALTHLSVRILRDLGVWEHFSDEERPPIHEARVLDGGSPYSLDFAAGKDPNDALGYIVSNHLIREALYEAVKPIANIDLFTERALADVRAGAQSASVLLSDGRRLKTSLVVAADSRFSETRRLAGIPASMLDFGRICIVCRMQHERPHHGIAFENFHYGRTLAVLPLAGNTSSIVVTAPIDQRDSIMDMAEAAFNDDIHRRFGDRYGAMQLVGKRFAYPLIGVHAHRFCTTRLALIGDAAVGMHPVTAHGYNLGLSGQDILAREIAAAAARGRDIGARELLLRYQRKHMRSTRLIYHGTNGIVKLFTDDRVPAKLARKAVLGIARRFPPIRYAIRTRLTDTGLGLNHRAAQL